MLYLHFIEEIFGIQGIKIKEAELTRNTYQIHVEMPRKEHQCPVCGEQTDRIHDYRVQKIKAGQLNGYPAEVIYRKRRYVCSNCRKKFYEENEFVGRYKRMTKMMIMTVLDMLKGTESFTQIAARMNISRFTVHRLFNLTVFEKPKSLPEVLGIDEFKGNTNGEKFQVILTDPSEKEVRDILPKRKENYLLQYFMEYPKEKRDSVKFFVSDMYKPYAEVAKICFPKAIHVIDRFHWERQITWAFERVRKDIQAQLGKNHRLYFKRSRYLLLKRFKDLKDDERQVVLNILSLSPELDTAYYYKEKLLDIFQEEDIKLRKKRFMSITDSMKQSGIEPLERCADTYYRWLPEILASLQYDYTNGYTEGCNNKIKVLKRNAYGYSNFQNFRKRALNMF